MLLGEVTPGLKCEKFQGALGFGEEGEENRVARLWCQRWTYTVQCWPGTASKSITGGHEEEEEQQRSLRPAERFRARRRLMTAKKLVPHEGWEVEHCLPATSSGRQDFHSTEHAQGSLVHVCELKRIRTSDVLPGEFQGHTRPAPPCQGWC